MNLCERIIEAAEEKKIDPFKQPFKPSDLGLKASDYGSFSDWCKDKATESAKYNRRVCLTVKDWRGVRPYRYVLMPRKEWC